MVTRRVSRSATSSPPTARKLRLVTTLLRLFSHRATRRERYPCFSPSGTTVSLSTLLIRGNGIQFSEHCTEFRHLHRFATQDGQGSGRLQRHHSDVQSLGV